MGLAARYAVPVGFGAPAPTAMALPAAMPPGVAFTPAPFGHLEPPWVTQTRMDAGVAEQAAVLQAQHRVMGEAARPTAATPMPAGTAGMYALAPFGLPTVPLNYQQHFGAGAMGQQRYV